MASILPGFEYDIFISYRHNDNRSGWVTDFVKALQEELASTIKEPLTIYFDVNPHDGLLETHNVDKSLEGKLKCLIFIPIISQTYCDPKSFAWQREFCVFNKLAKGDQFGRDIKVGNGNVASRILPIEIHDLDEEDKATIETEIEGVLRAIEFIYTEAGVNRPLKSADDKHDNLNKTAYPNQVNKVANAIKELVGGLKNFSEGARAKVSGRAVNPSKTTQRPNQVTTFWDKLKRRNLIKVATVYALTGWVVIQFASTVFPPLNIPAWVLTLLIFLILLGFPVALIFVWVFEMGDDGRLRSISSDQKHDRLPNYYIVISLAVLTALSAFIYFQFHKYSSPGRSVVETVESEKSIAVLPFENLSGDPKQEYFGDGIAEEILNSLTQIKDLKVAARTSSFQFKGKQVDLREMGKKLNVDNILEGSVRKGVNRIRITAQLISIKDGYHLWSQEYNFKPDDVLSVEEKIALAITEKLKVTLLRNEKIELNKKYTESTEAYDNYLKGNYFWNQRKLETGEKYFQEAVLLDSNFALGYEGLAKTYVLYQFFGLSGNLSMDKVEIAAKNAIALDSNLAVPYLCLAMKNSMYDWKPAVARAYFKKALRLNPKYPTAHYWYGQFLILYGGKKSEGEVISEMKRGYDLDPDNQSSPHNLGLALMHQGNYKEAIKEIKRSLELNPKFALPPFNLGLCYYASGDFEESKKAFEWADQLLNDQGTAYLPYFYLKEGKKDQAKAILNRLEELAKIRYVHELSFAIAASFLGEKDLAHKYFVAAIENHDTWLPYYLTYPTEMTTSLLSDRRNKSALPDVLRSIAN